MLTISGTTTLDNYQTALGSVTYYSTNEDPTLTNSNRSITWIVTDANSDGAGAANSSGVTSTITITALSDVPVVTAGGSLAYTENSLAAIIDNTIAISDPDDIELSSASVTISSDFTTGDVLELTTQNGISGTFESSTGVLTISGTASLDNYQTALRSITYHSTSEDPTDISISRSITWIVTDANSDGVGAANSSGSTTTINITPINDAPSSVNLIEPDNNNLSLTVNNIQTDTLLLQWSSSIDAEEDNLIYMFYAEWDTTGQLPTQIYYPQNRILNTSLADTQYTLSYNVLFDALAFTNIVWVKQPVM